MFSQRHWTCVHSRPVRRGACSFRSHVQFSSAFAQGLVESATGNAMRPKFSGRDVPSSRGRFTFPSPYNTEAVRLTEASDCNGSDCVRPVGYAYWSNINNHVGSDTMLVFLSLKGHGADALQLQQEHRRDAQPRIDLRRRQHARLGDAVDRRRLVLQRHEAERALHQRAGRLAPVPLRRARALVGDRVRCVEPDARQIHLAGALEQRRPRALVHRARQGLVRDGRLRHLP